jgi:hypothetical protein
MGVATLAHRPAQGVDPTPFGVTAAGHVAVLDAATPINLAPAVDRTPATAGVST